MFTIKALTKGDCDNNDNHAGVEILVVDDQLTRTTLSLCQKCLMAQVRLRNKGRKAEEPRGKTPLLRGERQPA